MNELLLNEHEHQLFWKRRELQAKTAEWVDARDRALMQYERAAEAYGTWITHGIEMLWAECEVELLFKGHKAELEQVAELFRAKVRSKDYADFNERATHYLRDARGPKGWRLPATLEAPVRSYSDNPPPWAPPRGEAFDLANHVLVIKRQALQREGVAA